MSNSEALFLGESISYWLELQRKAQDLGVENLMRELVRANAKVRYYEEHLKAMNAFREAADK